MALYNGFHLRQNRNQQKVLQQHKGNLQKVLNITSTHTQTQLCTKVVLLGYIRMKKIVLYSLELYFAVASPLTQIEKLKIDHTSSDNG